MVGGGGNANEAAGRLGLPVDLIEESEQFNDSGIYPDNAKIVGIFADMITQWRIGPNGKPSGLDYGVLPVVLGIRRVDKADEIDVFDGIRVMELSALKVIRER